MLRSAAGALGLRLASSLNLCSKVISIPTKCIGTHLRFFSKTPIKMVEGHQCHRVGHFHRKKLLGKSFTATSPNGRFVDGASAISGQPLQRIEIHGKNLFYFFGSDPNNPTVVHIHFGMSGAFSVHSLANAKDPKPTTRLALLNKEEDILAHLSAMTVQHGNVELYTSKASALGEDPLREDANPDIAWQKISVSKKPIGLLLMDQSVIAGVGNIYRAEILFKAGVHPEQPGYTLTRDVFDSIWAHSVDLLQRGFESGSILTVDPEEASVLGPPWTRRYIYNQSHCGRCKNKIKTWDMASRTVYCCPTCQPLVSSTETERELLDNGTKSTAKGLGSNKSVSIPAARKKAMNAAKHAVTFVSHCAPDDAFDASTPAAKLTVAQLQSRLAERGLDTKGRKAELVARLEAASAAEESLEESLDPGVVNNAASKEEERKNVLTVPTPEGANRKRRSRVPAVDSMKEKEKEDEDGGNARALVYPEIYSWGADDDITTTDNATGATTPTKKSNSDNTVLSKRVKSGTKGIERVATAQEAAQEKQSAGEGRNVEHVALVVDDVYDE